MRTCGKCGELKVPFAMDWPYWNGAKPVCCNCMDTQKPEPIPPKPLTEEDVRRIVHDEIWKMEIITKLNKLNP